MRFATFVTLKSSLFHKLLCFRSQGPIVSVSELTLLVVVDGPPPRTDINATSDADFVTRLLRIQACITRPLLAWLVPSVGGCCGR